MKPPSPIYSLKTATSDPTLAYLTVMVDTPRKATRQIRVQDLIPGLIGPDILVDVDANGVILGIELIGR